MRPKLDYVWPFVGLAAIVLSITLLSRELRGVELGDVWAAIAHRGPVALGLCVVSTLLAYLALAWYDRIALMHIGRQVSFFVVSVVSFTAYALAHNIGATVFSQGVVRYRAYSRYGLNVADVALITAFCAFTFAYGALFLGGLVMLWEPGLAAGLFKLPVALVRGCGALALVLVAAYQIGALLGLRPLSVRSFRLAYPRPAVALRQLCAAPLEIAGAAAIIYFALPEAGNPGFPVVLGVFLASFCAGLISTAPGGIGVIEAVFIAAIPLSMPAIPKAQVLAALLLFRFLYLLVPLLLACAVVLATERRAFTDALRVFAARLGFRPRTAPPDHKLPG